MKNNALWLLLAAALSFSGCAAKQSADANTDANEKAATTDAQSSQQDDFPDRGARNRQGTQTTNLEVLTILANAPTRSEDNRARNEARHPAETLDFFGIEPDMTVIEIGPGGGWYAEILRPYLLEEGRYIAALDAPDGHRAHYRKGWENLVKDQPELFGEAETTVFHPPQYQLADDDSIDLIVTFRHVHGWINDNTYQANLQELFRVLKPGGILGVVTHRAPEGADAKESAKAGYVPQDWLIEQAEEVGFELAETSEINANKKDTKDHPNGVWSLPPTLKNDTDDQRNFALQIGESDRMTLKFTKPEND